MGRPDFQGIRDRSAILFGAAVASAIAVAACNNSTSTQDNGLVVPYGVPIPQDAGSVAIDAGAPSNAVDAGSSATTPTASASSTSTVALPSSGVPQHHPIVQPYGVPLPHTASVPAYGMPPPRTNPAPNDPLNPNPK